MTGYRFVYLWTKRLLKIGGISICGGNGIVWTDYHFSKEEIQVLTECDRDSFYYRAMPIATLCGIGTYVLVRKGHLRANKIWGPTPKVFVAVTLGYAIGKYSYMSVCMEKLMELPDSELGFMLRQAKKRDQDVKRPHSKNKESLDLEKDKPSLKGLDKMFQKDVKKAKYGTSKDGRDSKDGKDSKDVTTQDIDMKVADECQINRDVQHKDCISEEKSSSKETK